MTTPANKEVVFLDDGTNVTPSGSTFDISPVEQVVATTSITESGTSLAPPLQVLYYETLITLQIFLVEPQPVNV